MRLKFENWWNEDEYTWDVVTNDTPFEPHAEPYIHRMFEEWSREYEPIRTTHWEVHFTMPREIERIEMDYTISPMDSITVNNTINQVGG
jgi:hypothetical protein